MDNLETRLRYRIDDLLDRLDEARSERDAAVAQQTEDRQQIAHLNRRVGALQKQREFWKERARTVHETNLLARRSRSTHGT